MFLQTGTSAGKISNSRRDRRADPSSKIRLLSNFPSLPLRSYTDRAAQTNPIIFQPVWYSVLCFPSYPIKVYSDRIYPFLEQKCPDGCRMSSVQKFGPSPDGRCRTGCHSGFAQSSFGIVRDPAIVGHRP